MHANQNPAPSEEPRTLARDLWSVLLKRKWMVLSFFLAVVGSVALFSFVQKPVYTALGTLWIDREPNVLPAPEVLQIESRDAVYYQSQFTILRSRALANATIEKNKLDENPHFAVILASREQADSRSSAVFREKLIDKLLERISVRPLRDTRIVSVGFDDPDPQFAADTLNALFEAFVDMNVRRKYSVSEQASEFLASQITTLRTDVEGLERKIQEYGAEKNIVSLSATETTVVNSLSEINSALSAASVARIDRLARYNQIKNAPLGSIPQAVDSPAIQRLSEEYSKLARDYAQRLEIFKPEFPEMTQLRKQVEDARAALEQETRNLVSSAYAEYQAALKNEQSLMDLFEKKKAEALNLNSNSIFYNSLKIEIQNKSALLEALLKRQSETEFSAQLKEVGTSNVWIVDRAAIPTSPTSPNRKLNMLLALVLGLLGGAGFAVLLEYFSGVVKNSRDVARITGLPTLGFIPLLVRKDPGGKMKKKEKRKRSRSSGRARGDRWLTVADTARAGDRESLIELISLTEPGSVQAENYRSIRTTLFVSSAPGKLKSFVITSPLAQEGKTSTAANLAITLAQAGKKTILVEADLRKPRLDKLFGMPNGPGLTSYVSGQADLPSVIEATDIPDLYVILSGPIPSQPVELLGSNRMDEAIAQLRKTFDYVLFDAPPLLLVSDAVALGPMIDAVILVVREGATPLSALKLAKQKLDAHHLKCFGVILNGISAYGQEGYYARQYQHYHK
jgi:succinoglycan biosynthesis transport protein ExoP